MNPLTIRLLGLLFAIALLRGGVVADPVGGPTVPLDAVLLQASALIAALALARRDDVFAIRYLLAAPLLGLTGVAILAVLQAVPVGPALWPTLAAQLIVFRDTLGLLADLHRRWHPFHTTTHHLTRGPEIMTGYVVTIASSKGGVGKTTLSLTLAGEFLHRGVRVALIDADPNRPLVRFAERATGLPDTLTIDGGAGEMDITDHIEAAAEDHDLVIVDLEGSASIMVANAIMSADLVLVPMHLSDLDAHEAAKVLNLIRRQAKLIKKDIPHSLVASCTSAAVISRNEKFIAERSREHGVPFLSTAFVLRDAFRAQFTVGKLLRDLSDVDTPNPGRAMVNANAIAREVLHLLTSGDTEASVADTVGTTPAAASA